MRTIKIPRVPSSNPKICGRRANIAQSTYNPMIPCPLKPRHKGPHKWPRIDGGRQ